MAKSPALPNLTSLRFFAAAYVIIFHFFSGWSYLSLGNTGVTLFFVLSGFILAYSYPSVPDRRRFWCLRFARIYPMYALSVVISLPQYVYANRHSPGMAASSVTLVLALLQDWFPPLRTSVNHSAWTLSVELFFYLSFPFLLPWVVRQVDHWKAWIAVMTVVLIASTATIYFVVMPAFPAHAGILQASLNMPIFHLGEFVMGMFFGAHFVGNPRTFAGWQVLLGFLFLAVCTAGARHIPWNYLELILGGLLALPYGLLILLLAGWKSRWFAHPLLQLGGEISYGMYLLQFPLGILVRRCGLQPGPFFGPVIFVLTAALAYVCYVYFEKPARILILRAAGYHPSPKPIPTPGLQT